MKKEDRLDLIRYRQWLFDHRPRRGYMIRFHNKGRECLKCNDFFYGYPNQRKCDNCSTTFYYGTEIFWNSNLVTQLDEIKSLEMIRILEYMDWNNSPHDVKDVTPSKRSFNGFICGRCGSKNGWTEGVLAPCPCRTTSEGTIIEEINSIKTYNGGT